MAEEPAGLLTVEEFGRRLSIGRTRAFRLVRSGEVRSVRIGTSRRVPVEEVRRFIDRLLADARPPPPTTPPPIPTKAGDVAAALLSFAGGPGWRWEGTAGQLLSALDARREARPPPGWPTTPRGLVAALAAAAPSLRAQGVQYRPPNRTDKRRRHALWRLPTWRVLGTAPGTDPGEP